MATKSNDVRLLDIFVFGPFWIYSARYMPPGPLRAAMVASGIITIVYNGLNYLDDKNPVEWWRNLLASDIPFLNEYSGPEENIMLEPITVKAQRLPEIYGSAMAPGETPEEYRARRLTELRITEGVPTTLPPITWVAIAVAAYLLLSK
jgi:hypothetical protein